MEKRVSIQVTQKSAHAPSYAVLAKDGTHKGRFRILADDGTDTGSSSGSTYPITYTSPLSPTLSPWERHSKTMTYTDDTAVSMLHDYATGDMARKATECEAETARFLDPDGNKGLPLTECGRSYVEDWI